MLRFTCSQYFQNKLAVAVNQKLGGIAIDVVRLGKVIDFCFIEYMQSVNSIKLLT